MEANYASFPFAWFGATQNKAASLNTASTSLNVSKNEINVDAITLEHLLKITVTGSANQLAHYNSTGGDQKLSTGYVDAGGIFHEHAKNNADVLYSTLSIKVEIDWGEMQTSDSTAAYYNYGWSDNYTKYTEGGFTYSLTELLDAAHGIVTQTSLKVLVKKTDSNSNIRFFATNAGSSDEDFGDIASVTDLAQFVEGKVNNVNANVNKGYLWFDTLNLSSLAGTTQASPKSVTTDQAAIYYYVYGGLGTDGTAGRTDGNGPISASLDVKLSN